MKSIYNYYNQLKLKIKVKLIQYKDKENGLAKSMELSKTLVHDMPVQFELSQCIMIAEFYENKCHNIRLAAAKINGITIAPRQVFSFWKIVGEPSEKRGYRIGRTLRNGQLFPEIGGGICQAACILYHTALTCGFEILERHNHSKDLYKEGERFTPLGADATVVYGNKDLRFRNSYPFEVVLNFEIYEDNLFCRIFARHPLAVKKLHFDRNYIEDRVEVSTSELLGDNNRKEITKSIYKI